MKSEASHALSNEEVYKDSKKSSKARAATGLYFLKSGRYESAVPYFIDIVYSLNKRWPEALCGYDLALYGGLCALASFNRSQLKRRVMW